MNLCSNDLILYSCSTFRTIVFVTLVGISNVYIWVLSYILFVQIEVHLGVIYKWLGGRGVDTAQLVELHSCNWVIVIMGWMSNACVREFVIEMRLFCF